MASKKGEVVYRKSDAPLNLYEMIEKAYGRERIVPTVMLLFAAKKIGLLDGEILDRVPLRYAERKTAYDENGNFIFMDFNPKMLISPDLEEYALNSSFFKEFKWKSTKKSFAIFVNMCIGGGWSIDSTKWGYEVNYDKGERIKCRDIWSQWFGEKIDIVNTYNQCLAQELQIKNAKQLDEVYKMAALYYTSYKRVMDEYKYIIENI